MVDHERVCCMCGDVGFADKLFRCSRCRFRFQHLYCSNYYNGSLELSSPSSSSSSVTKSIMEVCDWCQSEGNRNSCSSTSNKSYKRSSSSSSMDYHHHHNNNNNNNNNNNHRNVHIRSEYTSGERIKQQQHHQDNNNNNTSSGERGTPAKNNNSGGGVPSPRTSSHRRYKLLKDVMC